MAEFRLPDDAHIGHAHLRVTNLERSLKFYAEMMGFKLIGRDGATAALSAAGAPPAHLLLTERPNARPKPARSTGLYHIAIRLPDRPSLSRLFRRLIVLGWPFTGLSDHGVSEALYLNDPDGNGLELYRDRARELWPKAGDFVDMVTKPLDAEHLLAESETDAEAWDGIAPGTDMGHVHLHVSDLQKAERFYVDALGLTAMQRSYPGALFVAAGGYHHHLGLNTWAGTAAPPPDAVGLEAFSLVIPDAAAWETAVSRAQAMGSRVEWRGEGTALVHDADGNAVELVTTA